MLTEGLNFKPVTQLLNSPVCE